MSQVEFERMLSALLPSPGSTALTLTELPEGDDQLRSLVQSAVRLGGQQSSRLSEVHAPSARMGALAGRFDGLRIHDGGDVLRLVFEA